MKRVAFLWCVIGLLLVPAWVPVRAQVSALSQPAPRVLTLADSVALALQQNKTIQAAYLDRVAQRFDLQVAEQRFTPLVGLGAALDRQQSGGGGSAALRADTGSVSATVNQQVLTGARVQLSAEQGQSRSPGLASTRSQGWRFTLSQPLLQGAGVAVATAPLELARLNEQAYLLNLQATLTDTLAEVITAHRSYVRALKALEISRQSVLRARELLAINRTLIQSGRMAEIDMIQSEADLANQEFNQLAAENNVDAARLNLVRLLGLDTQADIRPDESLDVPSVDYDQPTALDLALSHRPDYQSQQLARAQAQLRLLVAQSQRLPDLSLVAGYSHQQGALASGGAGTTPAHQWNVGLRLAVPLNDLAPQQAVVAAQVALDKAELALAQQRESLDVEVRNALRNLEMSRRQVQLAQRALVLAEKKFGVESEKFKVGRSSNFQLVSFQNDLVNAQNNALNTTIAYLDALTALERTLGVLLPRWQVSLVPR